MGDQQKGKKARSVTKVKASEGAVAMLSVIIAIKKGHLKKDCYKWKREKGKGKKDENQKEEKKAFSVKIEEVNTLSEAEERDILFTSTMGSIHLVGIDQGISNDWVLDSGALFHVSPNCDWFTNYDAGRTGQV